VASLENWLFDDNPNRVDRFGLLLALTVLSVTLNSLVDVDDPTETLAGEVGWIITTLIVGTTLVLALSASGVARRPRRIATVAVVIVVTAAILISVFSAFVDSGSNWVGRPSLFWVLLAVASPFLVTRRLFLQERVTAETIFGAVAAFLLIALAFDYAFLSMDGLSGLSVFGLPQPTTSYMYFSLVTITTLGYGDLNPATEWARYLATAEAVIGTIFLVTIVARLVSMFGIDERYRRHRLESDESEHLTDQT
jgi:hypothetical protein